MIFPQSNEWHRFVEFLQQLSNKAVNQYYNPYRAFVWADSIPLDSYWMSPDLLSVYGTEYMDTLDEVTLYRLSKWESIHFYSLNVHGIRDLLLEVVARIHQPGFETVSDFLHHFIGEENEHMWFFSQFCLRYGGKIYPVAKLPDQAKQMNPPEIETFLVFAKILILEEMVDFFNVRMARDGHLHEIIQQVNRMHHQDEARHIAFGRRLLALWYGELQKQFDETMESYLENRLKAYIRYCINNFYNPHVYLDAGIRDAFNLRMQLLHAEGRKKIERQYTNKMMAYFVKTGVFRDEKLPDVISSIPSRLVVGG